MNYAVIEAKIYQWHDQDNNIKPDYIIMNTSDGKFLEWSEITTTGIEEIDEQIECNGSVVVYSTENAEAIIKAMNGFISAVRS